MRRLLSKPSDALILKGSVVLEANGRDGGLNGSASSDWRQALTLLVTGSVVSGSLLLLCRLP
jgi:hypothetical protein